MPLSSTTLMLRHNCHQLAIAIDQLGNVLVSCAFGEKAWADETLSAHAFSRKKIETMTLPSWSIAMAI